MPRRLIEVSKVYISGPILGVPDIDHEEKLARFDRAELVLRQVGHYDVVNPLNVQACLKRECNPALTPHLPHPPEDRATVDEYRHSRTCFIRNNLVNMLQQCDKIAMLPHWQDSEGSTLENFVARQLGFDVIDLSKNMIVLGLPHELQTPW